MCVLGGLGLGLAPQEEARRPGPCRGLRRAKASADGTESAQVQEAGQNEGHEISASAVLDGPCCSQRARDTCVSNSPNELPLECKVYRPLSTVIELPENLREGWC